MDRSSSLGLERIFSPERQQRLFLPSGDMLFIKYLNGLQFLGFFCAFFGLISCLLGMLDVIIVPALYSAHTHQFPLSLNLANVFGLPIYCGLMTITAGTLALRTVISQRFTSLRKFYFSLWVILLMEVTYWCCFIAAIVKGSLAPIDTLSMTTTNSLLVIRVFTAVNFVLNLMPCLTGLALYTGPVLGCYSTCGCCPVANSLSPSAAYPEPADPLSYSQLPENDSPLLAGDWHSHRVAANTHSHAADEDMGWDAQPDVPLLR